MVESPSAPTTAIDAPLFSLYLYSCTPGYEGYFVRVF